MRAKPYADRLFEYRELGRLSDPAARLALIKPAAGFGVDFDEDAALEVVGLAAGYPYFLQEYGRELWNAAQGSTIGMVDVEEVRDIVKEALARRGQVDFTVPLFAEYVLEHHPLTAFDEG